MKQTVIDDGGRVSDALWNHIEPLLPARKTHPLGCHNPRIPDRSAMDGILFVLRTGIRWNALDASGICTCSSAYRRFREWRAAGVFDVLQEPGLPDNEILKRIDWTRMMAETASVSTERSQRRQSPSPRPAEQGAQAG